MKQIKNKNVRQKYLVGSTIKGIIEDPSTALAQNDINIANAQYAGESNPWVLGLNALGNTAMQAGSAMGGFSGIKGIDPNLAKGLNGAFPAITQGLQSLATGGVVDATTNVGKTGMMKARMALDSHFGNPTARRMTNMDGKNYTFTEKDAIDTNSRIKSGSKGNVYISSYDNLITPQIQDVDGKLKFIPKNEVWNPLNADRSYNQSMKFQSPEDAEYFGEHYKEIAPMMKQYSIGGQVSNNIPVEVEGGEAGELPNGQLLDFNGPSHGNGGIPIDLPEGTEIYSKRIKIGGESMADRKLKRESILARYTKKVNKLGDAVSSNTLKRVQRSVDIEEEEDKKLQQLLHDMTTGVVNTGNQVMREQHAGGLPVGYLDPLSKSTVRYDDDYYNWMNLNGPANIQTQYPGQIDESLQTSNTLAPKELGIPKVNFDVAKINTPTAFPTKLPTPTPMSADTNDYSTKYVDVPGASKVPSITGGDALNIAGNIFSGVAPYLNTLNNRATDTPNVNAFKNYGEEGINKMAQAENYLKQTFDSRLKDIGLKRSDAIKRGRNSSGSVNLMRALDTNADMAGNEAENKAYDDYATQMLNILGKEAQLENEQDRMVMQGEAQKDLADRMDKDAFSTAKGQGLRDLGVTAANAGKQVNNILERNNQFNLLDSMYENVGYNPNTGQVYGKVAKSLNLKNGEIARPDLIKDAIAKGLIPSDYLKYLESNVDPKSKMSITTTPKGK